MKTKIESRTQPSGVKIALSPLLFAPRQLIGRVFSFCSKLISDLRPLTSAFCPLLLALCYFNAVLLVLGAKAEAQQPKVARIGYVDAGSPDTTGHRAVAFVQRLRELGYVDGQNIMIEYRWAEGKLAIPEILVLGSDHAMCR
jgi:hypothetical protein